VSGLFIVIEGSDGSGKTTQLNILTKRLEAIGYEVAVFDFPQYNQPSAHFIESYLGGKYGPAASINPYTASLFYALDRYSASASINNALKSGKIVLSNRYTGSNMAHQGSKFTNQAEQRGFFVWEDSLEFQLLGIPRPDLNIYLRVPAEISKQLISKRAKKSPQKIKPDQHEADFDHLKRAVATYDTLCQLFPKDYVAINCTKNGKILDIPTINNRIWTAIRHLLPEDIIQHAPRPITVKLSEYDQPLTKQPELVSKTDQLSAGPIMQMSISRLVGWFFVKNSHLGVRARTSVPKLPPKSPSYLKLDIPAEAQKKYHQVLKQIISGRNDLIGQLKAKNGPSISVDSLTIIHNSLSPMAELIDADLLLGNNVTQLVTDCASLGLPEFSGLSQKLNQPPKPAKTSGGIAIPQKLTDGLISYQPSDETVKLINFHPRNEFTLLADLLFSQSKVSRDEIGLSIDSWDYDQKTLYLRRILPVHLARGGLGPASVSYSWDLNTDTAKIAYLVDKNALTVINSQLPTPIYGYEVPEIIEKMTLTDSFVDIFDKSLSLHSLLESSSRPDNAAYAVLGGHKGRWQVSTSLSQLIQIANLANQPGTPQPIIELCFEIVSQVTGCHSNIGDFILGSTKRQTDKQNRSRRHRRTSTKR